MEDRALSPSPHHRPLASAHARGQPVLLHERMDLCLFLTRIVPQTALALTLTLKAVLPQLPQQMKSGQLSTQWAMRLGEAEPAFIARVRGPRNRRPVPNTISATALTPRLPAPPTYSGALVGLAAATCLT